MALRPAFKQGRTIGCPKSKQTKRRGIIFGTIPEFRPRPQLDDESASLTVCTILWRLITHYVLSFTLNHAEKI